MRGDAVETQQEREDDPSTAHPGLEAVGGHDRGTRVPRATRGIVEEIVLEALRRAVGVRDAGPTE